LIGTLKQRWLTTKNGLINTERNIEDGVMKPYGGKSGVERNFSHRGKSQGVKNAYRRFKKKARQFAKQALKYIKSIT